ncbi:MAG: DUF1987 domain-containing protein [Flavobacteriales bacterium]|nr:DUF1987 domain-containing protein [Flavobacteriales bacterium]
MNIYTIKQKDNSPYVHLDHNQHNFEFRGESRPENAQKFFKFILDWIEEYDKLIWYMKDLSRKRVEALCVFDFEYFNSTSAKFILDIIYAFQKIQLANQATFNIVFEWHFDKLDADMKESGLEYEDMIGMKFNFVEKD